MDTEAFGFLQHLRGPTGDSVVWQRWVFEAHCTEEQLMPLLSGHVKGFRFKLLREQFPDGVAFVTRTDDYLDMPVRAAVVDSPQEARRTMAEFVRGYVSWLRWAADEIERNNAELLKDFSPDKGAAR